MSNNWQRWKGILKCVPFEEKRLAKWTPPYIVQPKFDGDRCRAIGLDNGEFLLLSSEENVIFGVPHLNRILADRIKFRPIELDGELYCHGLPHETIHGIVSRSTNLHSDHELIQFHLFDIVNNHVQIMRTKEIEQFKDLSPWIQVSPFRLCYTLDDVLRAYDEFVGMSYEGIIVRNIEAPYERKRSTLVMKFKPKKEDCYEITGSIEEVDKEGVPKNRLGAITCKSGDGNLFNVGTGFTAEEREQLWSIRQLLPGATARVKYQHITSGKAVPRFPVFVEVKYNV
jgi:DNA ligase-1